MSIPIYTAIRIPNVYLSLSKYFTLSMRFTFKTRPIMWFMFIPLSVGILGWYSLFSGSISPVQLWGNGAGILHILMMLYVFILPYIMWYGTKKQYTAHSFLQTGATYQLTDDLLIIDTDASHTELAWPAVQTAQRIGSWLILLTSANVGYFVDTKRIAAPESAKSIYALLQAKQIALK